MRTGRRRKPGRRVNGGSGRLSRENVGQWPWKLMLEKARQSALDPLYLTELGRIYTEGEVTDEQVEAYKRFYQLLAAYHRIIGGPKRASSCGLEQGLGGGRDPDPDSPAGMAANQREVVTLREMTRAYTTLSRAGIRARMAVLRLYYRNENTPFFEKHHLLKGLNALCEHWSLTSGAGKAKIIG
jgi:hypothetical protein